MKTINKLRETTDERIFEIIKKLNELDYSYGIIEIRDAIKLLQQVRSELSIEIQQVKDEV